MDAVLGSEIVELVDGVKVNSLADRRLESRKGIRFWSL
jgi:hypothetical protein